MKFFAWALDKALGLSWRSAIWLVNGFFLLMTVIVAQLPGSGSSSRHGVAQYLAQFTLAEEKNLATYWEGFCLLLVAILAFERFLQSNKTATYEKQCWLGLSALTAGLSLDELGSLHERAPLLFSTLGLSGNMSSKIPLAIPVFIILVFTLDRMWRLANRRHFWLILGAFTLFGSVAFQEHLEFTVEWPWWAQGLRVGIEEGTELVGVFLLLSVFMPARHDSGPVPIISLAPGTTTLIHLKPILVFVTLATFIPLGILTVFVILEAHHRGVPAAWLPFVLLTLSWMAAWACAQKEEIYRERFFLVFSLALFFSLDQIIVVERVIDKNLVRGNLAILMFPCMAAACLSIRALRTRENMILVGLLLPLSLLFAVRSELLGWLVVPLQSLAIYWILTSALATLTVTSAIPQRCK